MVKVILSTALLTFVTFVTFVNCHSNLILPIDCGDIYTNDNTSTSGVYTIFPGGPTAPLHVYCDMDTDGGRWTVFQRRMDGSENFFRPWKDYKGGFGNVAAEYWLGLENIFLLTLRKSNELRVDMETWDGETAAALYSSFLVDSENSGYQLHLGQFTGGGAGDSFTSHNLKKFTTYDRDQDSWSQNCAVHYMGGFWYNECHILNPNGLYGPSSAIAYTSTNIVWTSWKGNLSLKTFTMKMRSASYCPCHMT
ncbi:microfibril-associated glycoprotein 4-like [Cynoglossus semilaevis]|uniref:Microfibril associated protein 4 n=1 Tax=Cynoglossus semilaevis TaxID=244447 RepID=A0A3P8UL93_CYNSE|nr:microfibril-associated glycoprotein 4-like [Cynoglossus semilaevis]